MKKFLFITLLILAHTSIFAQTKGQVFTFPENPKAGFEWGYLIYLPENIATSQKLPILFMMNNSGVASCKEEMEEKTLQRLKTNQHEKRLADKMGVPLLMPFVLRENNDLYPHELNRAVFVLQEGSLKRLDLQILNIFKDARKQLKKKNIDTQKKMFIAGASAAGAFAWRWTLLHPEYVIAAVAAVQHYPTLPLEKYDGNELFFPIGISDIKKYTGKKFNKKVWLEVPIFIYEGEKDFNDPLPYNECYPEEQRELIHKLYDDGVDDTLNRVQNIHKILVQIAPNVQTYIYPNIGHKIMEEDSVKFLLNNKNGNSLNPIAPIDTTSWKPDLPLQVKALYYGKNAPTDDKEYLEATDLTMKIQKSSMAAWAKNQKKCKVDIMKKDKEILHGKTCSGIFYEKDFFLLQIDFTKEEIAKLKTEGKTFTLRSHFPKILNIPADLTFNLQ